MKIKRILFLFITLLGYVHQADGQNIVSIVSTNTPVCKYFVVNFDDGLTTTLFAGAGGTSLTFRIEWQPDLPIPCGWLELMVKWNLEDEDWIHFMPVLPDHPEQGYENVSLLIDEDTALWNNTEGGQIPQVFFRFKVHELDGSDYADSEETEEELERIRQWQKKREPFAATESKRKELVSRLVYESNEERFAELARLDARGATEAEKEVAMSRLIAKFEQRLSDALARLDAEEAVGKATASPPNRLWFYVGILLALSVLFYLVRRKLKTGN